MTIDKGLKEVLYTRGHPNAQTNIQKGAQFC
jgi:hypothetical protein